MVSFIIFFIIFVVSPVSFCNIHCYFHDFLLFLWHYLMVFSIISVGIFQSFYHFRGCFFNHFIIFRGCFFYHFIIFAFSRVFFLSFYHFRECFIILLFSWVFFPMYFCVIFLSYFIVLIFNENFDYFKVIFNFFFKELCLIFY